jgi:sRNA-binding protein
MKDQTPMTTLADPPANPSLASLIPVLSGLFPVFISECWREHRPLKIGIDADLIATGILKGWETKIALRHYCSRRMYLKAVAGGGPRFDLHGNPAGEVSIEDREWARTRLAEIDDRQARKAASIQASREAEHQAVRQQKEAEKAAHGRAPRTPSKAPRDRTRVQPSQGVRRDGLSDLRRAAAERRAGKVSA